MRTRSRAFLIAVVLTALGVVPALASTVTVDEYGNGFFDSTPLTPLGPTGQGFGYALPFSTVTGTLAIIGLTSDDVGCFPSPFGPACDVVTFSSAGQMFFASAAPEGSDSPADLLDLAFPFTNLVVAAEVGPEGANGATYTPQSFQAGFDASDPTNTITYNFVSDGVVPEPNTLVLFGTGILGTLGLVGLRGKTRLSS